jgi:hypothetical protein
VEAGRIFSHRHTSQSCWILPLARAAAAAVAVA